MGDGTDLNIERKKNYPLYLHPHLYCDIHIGSFQSIIGSSLFSNVAICYVIVIMCGDEKLAEVSKVICKLPFMHYFLSSSHTSSNFCF